MLMADSLGPSLIPSNVKLQVVIGMLTTIIKVGKYLPYIVFTFATVNLTLAILDLAIWGNVPFGMLNTILAVGGFVLSGQLHQKRAWADSTVFYRSAEGNPSNFNSAG